MKLSKRFSLLKKSLGLTLLASCMLAINSCNNVTSVPRPTMTATLSKSLSAPTFPEHTTDNEGNEIAVTYAERYYTVSQGARRRISLSWNKVEIAKYYEVFSATNINDTFVKVGETKKAEFDDSVGSGKTYWYKVRAVNGKGERSDFSAIIKGTSLATPAITGIDIKDTSAELFWYMGNVGIDTYAKNLVYEIHASSGNDEKVATIKAWDEANESVLESYKFENLSGNAEYSFQVIAYVTYDQGKTESSPKVTKKTLSQYTPVSPEFTASQGESVDGIKLFIKLPTKVQVSIGSGNTANEYDFPLCFEVQRKRSSESTYRTIISPLYFNGTEAKPTKEDYETYSEGSIMEYTDLVGNTSASVARGVKYDYRIVSCIDSNYAKVSAIDYDNLVKSKEDIANTAQGWAAAHPVFKVVNFKRNLDENGAVQSISLGFNAEWNDLGKASLYKFAIQYNKRISASDTEGTNGWIQDSMTNILLGDLEKVSSLTKTYDFTVNPENVAGIYRYTLYVIPESFTSMTDEAKNSHLDKVEAPNVITISNSDHTPITDLTAEGGWTDHTRLAWTVEDGVTYSIDWKKYNSQGSQVGSGRITSESLLNGAESYTGIYEHYVESGFRYEYILNADLTTQPNPVYAETLGTPAITFAANSYTDITVSWKQVMAAKEYNLALGSAGTFGNGCSFIINNEGAARNVPDGLTVNSIYDSPTQIFTVTISKPFGYNNALLSGKATPLVVTAISELDGQNNVKDKSTATKDVWTIGPASTNLKATETYDLETTSIKISWKALEGATGYAVYRQRPPMTGSVDSNGNTKNVDSSLDVYYVSAQGVCSSSNVNVNLSQEGIFTLTDIYAKASNFQNATNSQKNQQYIALGIPFTYTVLPVLSNEHVDTYIENAAEWKLPETSDSYSNLSQIQKDGYTVGYGIALEATKAEHSDKVLLNWELPQSAELKGYLPNIYVRKKGSSGAWIKLGNVITNAQEHIDIAINQSFFDKIASQTAAMEIDDIYTQALEYAVTYDDSMDISASKNIAYAEYQSQLKNEKITAEEPKCVGYMFTLPKIKPVKQTSDTESFMETVQWNFYDFTGNRAVGGSDIKAYALELLNLNCSGAYQPIYTYDASGNKTSVGNKSWYNASFTTATSGQQVTVTVTPSFANDGKYNTATYHDGLLKVQRDYKHYYKISASRQNSQGTTITADSEDYAYRKITEDERNKAVGLICADAFYQMGIPGVEGVVMSRVETTKTLSGNPGTLTLTHTAWVKEATWQTSKYQHVYPRTPGNQNTPITSAFIITIPKSTGGSFTDSYMDGYKLNKLPATTITIEHELDMPSYEGTWPLREGFNDTNSFPYHFGEKHKEDGTQSLNSSFYTYNGVWWEVQ